MNTGAEVLENSIPMWVYNEMTFNGKRYCNYLLNNDAMPAELSYLLEAWTRTVGFDPWVVEQSLRFVAIQFGFPADDPISEI